MPVVVQDYKWTETINNIVITVPLKGVKSSKVDIYSSDDYIKVRTSTSVTTEVPTITSRYDSQYPTGKVR